MSREPGTGGTSPWGHMSGAAGVVASLWRAGVRRVFGIPAIETTHLFDAFASSPIEIVLTTHEHAAAIMADAHARATGSLAACLLAPGPGLTNALTGIAGARCDSSPLVALVAGRGGGLGPEGQVDSLDVARPVCKRAFRLEEPEEVPPAMARACRLAVEGEPGPVLVEVPVDVQRRRARMEGTGFRPGPRVLSAEAAEQLDLAARKIDAARQVGIYAGQGCFGAEEELRNLAELLNAPVASSISGLGCLPFIHPLSVGFGPGRVGSPLAESAFEACDLILAMGCRFSEAATGAYTLRLPGELIHIDVQPGTAGRFMPASLAITAPARQAMRLLIDRTAEKKDSSGVREIIRQGKRELRRRQLARPAWRDAVDPVKFFVELRELLSSEDVVVLDSGHHAVFGVASYRVQAPRTLIAPVDSRTVGFGVPAAVAVKLAMPETRVVGCVGDSGFLRTGLELLSARRCNVAPVIVVFADGKMDFTRAFQERVIGRETCVDLVPVDYESLARSLGVEYLCIRCDAALVDGLKAALTAEAPVVVELRVAYREATAYLRATQQAEIKNLPRASVLRLGSRLVLRKLGLWPRKRGRRPS
ncbi:MAG: thiamine pyrophosphate-binding protein [Deltaproteobacteria bacterium]|nr:thiamine pyrophosphate-binding protein [Deltaproteobacteria bacterium]